MARMGRPAVAVASTDEERQMLQRGAKRKNHWAGSVRNPMVSRLNTLL